MPSVSLSVPSRSLEVTACTAGAPVCFHAMPTSYERDHIVMGQYMNKGDGNVCCFSQFKNIYGEFGPNNAFFNQNNSKSSCSKTTERKQRTHFSEIIINKSTDTKQIVTCQKDNIRDQIEF